jgi:type I restriction enzyme R subunit
LRAVQSVFLQKRHLETADLYEPPLDMFGTDAVERWFTEKEVEDILSFVQLLSL